MANRSNEYVKRRWKQLIEDSGGKCAQCPSTERLEFAHLEPTGLRGRGRGRKNRLFDILKHPEKYVLLCGLCHDEMDGLHRYERRKDNDTRRENLCIGETVGGDPAGIGDAWGSDRGADGEMGRTPPVAAQLALAEKIGENANYQTYLITVEQIKANQAVGVAQAAALEAAEIKVIANGGTIEKGVSTITDVLSSKGGQSIGAMLEGIAQSEIGKEFLKKVS